MRRREYLHAAVGAAGLTGLSSTALGAGSDDVSPSTRSPPRRAATGATDAYGPLGRVDVTNDLTDFYQAAEAVTTDDGSHAFVSRFDGFEVVDLDDPANPVIVHTATDLLDDEVEETLTAILDLKYDDDRLIVAAGFGLGFVGFAVYDVSDPANPTLSTYSETDVQIHNCYLDGSHAYLTARTAIVIYDLEPETPERVARWSVVDYDDGYGNVDGGLRIAHDLYVQDDRLYIANWDAGTWILDVSDPSDPTHVGHVSVRSPAELQDAPDSASMEPPGNDHYVQPNDDGSLLFVGAEAWNDPSNDEENGADDPGGPGGIRIYDVEDLSEPTELATIDAPPVPEGESATRRGFWTTSHNFDVVGDYLYSSWYRAGVKVHDVSDPENPEELVHWENSEETMFWTARVAVPGEFFVGSSMNDPTGDGTGGLYTFPDPTGDETVAGTGPAEGTATATPTDSPTATATESSDPTEAPTDSPTATEMSAPATTATSTDPPTETATDAETTSGEGPGFGPLATLGALGLGARRFRRPDDED